MKTTDCINYLLTVSQNKVFQYFVEKLKKFEITPAQYGVLSCLWQNYPQTPKQIGGALFLEASSISGILDRMQKKELIIREIDQDNRRNILIYPTEKGKNLQKDIELIVEELNIYFLENFTEEEKTILRKMLTDIINKN